MALIAFSPLADNGSCAEATKTAKAREAGAGRGGPTCLGLVRRWQGRILAAAGLALLPWLGYLAGTLPPAEAAAWVTLDALEAAALLTAGTRLLRADLRHRTPAAAAAILLFADACMDLATAAPGPDLSAAIAMAVAAELPLAALCARLAARPTRGARQGV
ncbi:hypothetical protein SSP35_15_00920 [Streptomyces sp. NBRC 110611]|uniref:hypothetical protein n=1 Tax=Streptomyces sp. NBRC 110611 TaxID=1621259 RepID=UPI0008581D31|nr:hypothetical protein [Streptomyces sp. NBRC 110611]GAU69937.1 hypothetical protein SSP35_15_00920 [Streptomyces sp. NBRC 110611]